MLNTATPNWLPQYTVRYSKRAKRASLHIDQYRGLEVIIPHHKKIDVLDFLITHKAWILKNYPMIQAANVWQQQQQQLPQTLHLPAKHELWRIIYLPNIKNIHTADNNIICCPQNITATTIRTRLKVWLKKYITPFLYTELQQVATKTGLAFNSLKISNVKTKWGHCDHNKNIMLNLQLALLPYNLMSYVMLHELCHTVHLNHSRQFWRLLASFEPNFRQLEKKLKQTTTMWL